MANNLPAIIWNSVSMLELMRKREQEASSQIEPLAVHLLYLFRPLQLALSTTMREQRSERLFWAPPQKTKTVLHSLATLALNSPLSPGAFHPQGFWLFSHITSRVCHAVKTLLCLAEIQPPNCFRHIQLKNYRSW